MEHFEQSLHRPYIAALSSQHSGNECQVIHPGFPITLRIKYPITRARTFGQVPVGSLPVLGAQKTSRATFPSRSSQVYGYASFFQTILPLPSQTVEKRQI